MNRSLLPLAGLYGAGTRLRLRAFQKGWFKTRRLAHPVISVGNLTVGGSGKTPLVALVAEVLLRQGYKPAILTRGYGRERGTDLIVLEPMPARTPDSRATGDEPALLARALPQIPIVICANRFRAGQLAEHRFGVDVHILDDGFQHFRVERDIDLVAVDVTQELEQDLLVPAGRLREPVSALSRADVIVLTRTEIRNPRSTEKLMRRVNPKAKIFGCTTELQKLREVGGPRIHEPGEYRGRAVCAFCAIGNPSAFFSDLRRWGFHLISEITFRDHHVYSAEDVKRLKKMASEGGATVFLTTEKDGMNLPAQLDSGLPVLSCTIRAEISDSDRFEQVLLAGLASKQVRSKVVSRS